MDSTPIRNSLLQRAPERGADKQDGIDKVGLARRIRADEKCQGFKFNVAFLNASKVLYGKPVNLNSTFHGLSQCLISSEQMDVAVAVGPPVLAASRLSGRLVPVLNR